MLKLIEKWLTVDGDVEVTVFINTDGRIVVRMFDLEAEMPVESRYAANLEIAAKIADRWTNHDTWVKVALQEAA